MLQINALLHHVEALLAREKSSRTREELFCNKTARHGPAKSRCAAYPLCFAANQRTGTSRGGVARHENDDLLQNRFDLQQKSSDLQQDDFSQIWNELFCCK